MEKHYPQNLDLPANLVEGVRSGRLFARGIMDLHEDPPAMRVSFHDTKINHTDVLAMVIEVTGVRETKIISRIRSKEVSYARHLYRFLCRKYLNYTLQECADVSSWKPTQEDHALTINSVRRVGQLKLEDEEFRQQLATLEKRVKAITGKEPKREKESAVYSAKKKTEMEKHLERNRAAIDMKRAVSAAMKAKRDGRIS